MKKYVVNYLQFINEALSSTKTQDYNRLKALHLQQIEFIQHERLIHLIVTCLFSIVIFICLMGVICFEKVILIPLLLLLLVLLIPYISHYYFLENSVQKMYEIYNELQKRADESMVD